MEPLSNAASDRFAELAHERRFKAGEPLMRLGEQSGAVYMIVQGKVRVLRAGAQKKGRYNAPVVVAELGPGEVVGEMGVLSRAPRSATVVAVEDTLTHEVQADLVEVLLKEFPELRALLMRSFGQRLRASGEFPAVQNAR